MLRVANPNPNVSKPNSGRERKKDLNNSFKNTRKPTLTAYSNSIQFKITSLRKTPAQKHGYHYLHPQNTTNVSALQTLKTDFHANLFFSFRAANERVSGFFYGGNGGVEGKENKTLIPMASLL